MTDLPAIVVLNQAGLATARRLRAELPGAQIHGLARRLERDVDISFPAVAEHLRMLFVAGRPIIALCATGIVVRALAPVLDDKTNEPPVMAVASDGAHVVPLLGGHRGANRLARRVAVILGGGAAITTAGDMAEHAIDDPPPGWTVANPAAAKPVAAAILAGAPVGLLVEAGDAGWLAGLTTDGTQAPRIHVTDRAVEPGADELLLHPPTLALGVGCERGTQPAEVTNLVTRCLEEAGLAAASVVCLVSLDLKSDEPAIHAAAAALGVPVRFFDAPTLEAETPRLANPSAAVFAAVGCHGVAEAAALTAVGPDGTLCLAKRKSVRATCAIARHAKGFEAAHVGRARGTLFVVGLGPGAPAYRLPAADIALAQATDIVGYGRYLDLLGPVPTTQRLHSFALGEEEARCRHALDLAASGRSVALVCSGDPGVYAMASLVLELLDGAPRGAAVEIVPGVSALHMAAARAGAPLGHDYCAVSLSDLLTPWREIERRLEAAGAGDFVVALYNPASRQRRHQLGIARDILLRHRRGDTPVVIARHLARDGESVEVVPLAELGVDMVDMMSVVIVGNCQTRSSRGAGRSWVYTPRGYGPAKAAVA